MKPLLKAARVTGEPIVLMHAIKWSDSDGAPSAAPGDVAIRMNHAERAVTFGNGPGDRRLHVTYEEYKQRLESESAELERKTRSEGFERGYAEGLERAQSENAEQREALAKLVASARESLDQAMEGVSEIGTEIVCEALAKIVGQAMTERQVVTSAIREVIRRAKDRTKLVIRVSRSDWRLLEGYHDQLTEGLNAGSVEIVPDEHVQLGGCVLETPAGDFDGRLEVQLERLWELLKRPVSAIPEQEVSA
ncbi:MAG TPA: FliH/SctL family protein [Burkholderiales bacterium]